MHSLETGIIVSIAAFFFLAFMTFVFLREVNISKEIDDKIEVENNEYKKDGNKNYYPEIINNISEIIIREVNYVGESETGY